MNSTEIRRQWENAAPGWARWESTVATWMQPATDTMFSLAGVTPGARVLDIACGAGSQTLVAARSVGADGHVVASDIADAMVQHVRENARAAGLANVTTLVGAAEDLAVDPNSFDAVICRLGLMLFAAPANALTAAHRALRPGGRLAAVVFTTPDANPFMARPLQVLLRHSGKTPPAPGRPGIFSLGAPGRLAALFTEAGFADVHERTVSLHLRLPAAADALTMIQQAFGLYRAIIEDSPEPVRDAAWAEVGSTLESFESPSGFVAPAEVIVVAGTRAD
ncbi:MAG: methyltransferase domain-containing protein [bacterium]